MDAEELEDLRKRVARRQRAEEAAELKRELAGQNRDIDTSVIWVPLKEIAKTIGVSRVAIQKDINKGALLAVKAPNISKNGTFHGVRWLVHPDDAKAYIDFKLKLRAISGQ